MKRSLHSMSVHELGRLFPVLLEESNPSWPELYAYERRRIEGSLGSGRILRITHIGSTSVPGLVAKPTVDILLEVDGGCDLEELKRKLLAEGYLFEEKPGNSPPHMMFMKGYTERGFEGQAFHLHVRYLGDWDELYFAESLRSCPERAEEYARLKRALRGRFPNNREEYTAGKSEFVRRVTEEARERWGALYRPKP